MPVADVSLTLSIGLLVFAIVLLVIGLLLANLNSPPGTAIFLGGVWLGTAILWIWKSGKSRESQGRNLDLRVMHALPLLMLIMCIPHFSNWDDISYMLGFVEVLISGALVIYGLICLRILVLPPWQYWCYLILNAASVWILVSRP